MSNNIIEYKNLIAFHPSSYIHDVIEDLNITQEEFANRLGVSSKVLSELLNAKTNLSPDMAVKLESLTGVSYNTWMNIQNQYDKKKIEISNKKQEDEKTIIDSIQIRYFKQHNLIEKKRYKYEEKAKALKKLLNIADMTILGKFNPVVSYRSKDLDNSEAIINSNVMLEIASNQARGISDVKLNRNKLQSKLPYIKNLTLKEPREFYPELKNILLECGVVLIALPHLQNSNLHGAVKKFNNGSVLLLITDRNKAADIFWFSLMHEIFHIINGDFYTNIENKEEYLIKERRADESAEDFFINQNDYKEFVLKKDFSEKSIINFCKIKKIKPIILIGRLRKDEYLPYSSLIKYNEQYKIKLNI